MGDRPVKILIVDDRKLMRHTLVGYLEAEFKGKSFDIHEADNGLAVHERLVVRREKFDLVLLDWNMPGITGLEVLEAAVAADPEAKIVMVTSETASGNVNQAIAAGAVGYLKKGNFGAKEFAAVLRQNLPAMAGAVAR